MPDLKHLPDLPGCYLFKDSEGNIIYVGKAKSLKKRVPSYFQKRDHDPKTAVMVGKIADIDFIMTPTEVDALILENNLIKRHQPKWNIDLKDAKRFAYIHLTDEDYPRLEIARSRQESGQYFGPFTSAGQRDEIIQVLNRIFHLRTCKHLPHRKPCERHHYGCDGGRCAFGNTPEEYGKRIFEAISVIKGRTGEVIALLEREMKEKAKVQRFECAMKIRDQIEALNALDVKQTMQRQKRGDEDIIDYVAHEGKVYLLLFNVYSGTLAEKSEFVFDAPESFFEEFIVQYYGDHPVPAELVLRKPLDSIVHSYLEEKRGSKVTITVPKFGEKRQLLDLVMKNIEIQFYGGKLRLEAVKESLRLEKLPSVIECFDISHLSGTSVVGSMVQFRDGKPDKSNYRRFKIRSVAGIDDVAAIKEVVSRRYLRLKNEGATMPDLVVIDGGIGQLHAAEEALTAANVHLPVIAIAKRFEEIYMPGISQPFRLDPRGKALLFIRQIRDEAHRFAIAYNRLLRKKEIPR